MEYKNKEEYLKDSKEMYDKFNEFKEVLNLFEEKYLNNDEIIENNSNESFCNDFNNFIELLNNERMEDFNELCELFDVFDELLMEFDENNKIINKLIKLDINGYIYDISINIVE